jgi:nicotinamidase/pyrazinamidase
MTTALLMIDIQNDFCPGGALAVAEGNAVVPVANRMQADFPLVVATQDWHPAGHSSFAESHAGAEPFGTVENDRETPTGLTGYLRDRGVTAVTLVGLATDFCVAYSALDARRMGFDATVVMEGCRAIDLDGSLSAMTAQMGEAGVTLT